MRWAVAEPEAQLCLQLKFLRAQLISSTNVATAELAKNFPARVYKHFQFPSPKNMMGGMDAFNKFSDIILGG